MDLRLLLFFGSPIYFDIWQDSLDEWSARRKASTYTGQHNTERQGTNIHALSGIRNHDPSNQPAKAHASDRTATGSAFLSYYLAIIWNPVTIFYF
jgi:hypothetical protein